MWGHPPKYSEDLIHACKPDNDFEEAVVQFMKDTIKGVGHLGKAIPDIGAGVTAMDHMAQALVVEVTSLKARISKREERMKVTKY